MMQFVSFIFLLASAIGSYGIDKLSAVKIFSNIFLKNFIKPLWGGDFSATTPEQYFEILGADRDIQVGGRFTI